MNCDVLAKAFEAAPHLLDQAVALGRIECVIGLIFGATLAGCAVYVVRWSRGYGEETDHRKCGIALAAFLATVAVIFVLVAAEGLAKSFVAPKAYAVKMLLP